ncbi:MULTISPECIES: hypothetical protein [unclassified Nocardia]|uniref:hypothetical protein n=1 Tax=Nocardia sp. NPDC056064 TaxID=3345701 RepID=UPI0035D6DC19
MDYEPDRPVELSKDRVQDAPEPVVPPPPVRPDQQWPGVELPPYPGPPPAPQPMFPAPGYPRGQYGVAPYGPPQPLPPRYGYVDTTPIWSVLSFCCVAASFLGGALLCGLPVLVTVPTGVILGIVGHTKGEQLGKWAATANAVVGALAVLAVVVFFVALGSA